MDLTAADFRAFYKAANGYDPFPWQRRLVAEIIANGGEWPWVLDLPTGSGKTSAIDVAVFLLALEVAKGTPRPVHERKAALRTFFVVDRRIVVDEAGEKARRMACLLNAAAAGPEGWQEDLQAAARKVRAVKDEDPDPLTPEDLRILRDVATRLKAFGGDKALHVSVLRGGMYRDASWAESPVQPTICLCTVDQVGSRLLFRGYGVSPYQRALHAGLVGNDSLILVDEAHLSRPFLETLRAVEFYRSEKWAESPVRTPFRIVVMSATAGEAAEPVCHEGPRPEPFRLNAEDEEENNDVKLRLSARKLARLVEAGGDSFVGKAVEEALRLADPPPTKGKGASAVPPAKPALVIGVVVNRVATARRIADLLRERLRAQHPDVEDNAFEVVLLTGRIRPYDRDELLIRRKIPNPARPDESHRGLMPFVKATANADRTDYGRPTPPYGKLFVVATQTVEVGADFSFDALVSEAASLDALRQRFGRLDRLGFRQLSDAVILRNKEADKDDPVYGGAVVATWKWLKELERASGRQKVIDFGILAMRPKLPADVSSLSTPRKQAPVMLPAHVEEFVQTSNVPPAKRRKKRRAREPQSDENARTPDPQPPSLEPAVFLHGEDNRPADVSIVWRADLTQRLLQEDLDTDGGEARQILSLVPPLGMEALPMPIWAVRKWLARRQSDDVADVEGQPAPEPGRVDPQRVRPFVRWRGPDPEDGTELTDDPEDLRPGDTIVVPSAYGGCDEFGWNPDSSAPVSDVADDCSWRAKRRPVLRVHRDVAVHQSAVAAWSHLRIPFPADAISRLETLRNQVDPDSGETDWNAVQSVLREQTGKFSCLRKAKCAPYPDDGDGLTPGVLFVVRGMPIPYPDETNLDGEEAPGTGDDSSFNGSAEPSSLEGHCMGVRDCVTAFAGTPLRLDDVLTETLKRAALLHDAGKADQRFQLWLYGGNEASAAKSGFRLIAKSETDARHPSAIEAARQRAEWPKGARHEAMSVLLVRENAEATCGIDDRELLLYLIGAHHGRGRPVWPVELDDGLPPGSAIDSEHFQPIECAIEGFTLSAPREPRPEAVLTRLCAGWADLFWRLIRRYGYWGLAYLETLLVLADHRQSEAENEACRE